MTLTADGKEVEYIPYEEGSDREINRANEAKRKEEEEILERQRIEQKKFEEIKAKMESAVNITQANNDILKIRSINQIMGETDMEVISEQNFGKTLHENADRNTMQDEEDINHDVHVGEDYENEDHEVGEYECIPDCAESIKPYLGQRFQTLDEGVRYYKEYAAFVRASTMKKNRYGDVEVKYLLCSREGYTVAKAQSSSTVVEGNRANINTRRQARSFLKINRNLEVGHQAFIVACEKANIGTSKAFDLYNVLGGGLDSVGAACVDFRNCRRDVLAQLHGADAQSIIEKYTQKKALFDSYTFDYDVDDEQQLCRVFWCDPIAKQNYLKFGEMVSFDATYRTNREEVEDITVYTIKEGQAKSFKVSYSRERGEIQCSCGKFKRVGILCQHVLVVLKDDDAEMISPKYVVQRWTKNGNAKETEANTKYNDENKLVGKVWIEFNNYMALSKGNIKDLQGILNFMQGKKGKMMKRKGMIEAKRKSSDLVETFYGTQTSNTIK
nr:protein FAR1-RELATED SEQUENCE 5-like [Ipomoea batatas]